MLMCSTGLQQQWDLKKHQKKMLGNSYGNLSLSLLVMKALEKIPPSQTFLLQTQLLACTAEHKRTQASAHSNIQVAFLYLFSLMQRMRFRKKQGLLNEHALRWLSFDSFSAIKIYHKWDGGVGNQHSRSEIIQCSFYEARLHYPLQIHKNYIKKSSEIIKHAM